MKPFEPLKLPITYKIDKELLSLISEANAKYGEYKTLLNTADFDSKFFLDSILLSETIKSTQIEGTQISQDEMYYLKYRTKSDDKQEIENLKEAIDLADEYLKSNKQIDIKLINEMHRVLLNSVRGSEKSPGELRTNQNWIGPRGVGIEGATFIPPIPEEVPLLLDNLINYMNDEFVDPLFINIAISHSQFETIHPYKDGNGRLGRALISIQLSKLTNDNPILFLSEVIELYKAQYYRTLNESRKGNMLVFIKFFMQCIIDQCNSYIYKINRIKTIYEEDMQTISRINGASVYKIMPVLMKQIVFTKKEIELESGVSSNVTSKTINKLVELGIIEKDYTITKRGYKYKRIFDVFVGQDY